MKVSSTELFSDRAKLYAAFRPEYPPEVFQRIVERCPLPACAADIGAGTGIFSRGLLRAGYKVVGIEPNSAMRVEAMATLNGNVLGSVVEGQGEATGLSDSSMDLVTVAQAFHWLNKPRAKAEFRRIGKPGCAVAIAWNARQFKGSEFMRGYRQMLLDCAPRYAELKNDCWESLDADASEFLGGKADRFTFANEQQMGLDAIIGGLLSTSYAPKEGEADYGRLLDAARCLFAENQRNGVVSFLLQTILYVGNLDLTCERSP